jgi:hypothetical protein
VIASHYAEPVGFSIGRGAMLLSGPSEQSEAVRELAPGEPFELLDDTLGWAWGYAGVERRVGYVETAALSD